jgi:predicted NBD/HSP70 family sugar kinase
MRTTAHKARALRRQGALAVLRLVHATPGVTRAELSRSLGLSSGSATEITARLKALQLVEEVGARPGGGRGRPSPALTAHPDGPLVCAVDISHEAWRVAVVELGGRVVEEAGGRHRDRAAPAVLGELRRRVAAVRDRFGDRLRAVSVTVDGTTRGTTIAQAATLRWEDVSLEPLRPDPSLLLLAGNDASVAGLAEARRGAGTGATVLLHLIVEVGIGGVLVVDGRLMAGATGAGGEFGHMPFGDPGRQCPCGAYGCWDLEVDGRGMARTLGWPPPADPRTAGDEILLAAGRGDQAAQAAVVAAATALGRGIGALVNALDPDAVTLSGLGPGLVETAPTAFGSAYHGGLMRFRRRDPPPVELSLLGEDGRIVGAAEVAFDAILTDEGLEAWSRAREAAAGPVVSPSRRA